METFFKKVSAKERLPQIDGMYICEIGDEERLHTCWTDVIFKEGEGGFTDESPDIIFFWLEEIHYYTEEELKQFELTRIKIAKATDNFMKTESAVTPNEV